MRTWTPIVCGGLPVEVPRFISGVAEKIQSRGPHFEDRGPSGLGLATQGLSLEERPTQFLSKPAAGTSVVGRIRRDLV
jgi:hypothetical protein